MLHELLLRRRERARLSLHAQLTLWGSAALLLGGALALGAAEWSNARTLAPLEAAGKVWAALFASVSILSYGMFTIAVFQSLLLLRQQRAAGEVVGNGGCHA